MNGLEIKISSRSLVLLLAGSPLPKLPFTKTPTIGEFHPGVTKYFEQRIKDGRTIQTIRIERNDDSDDDWVVITFGDPDPAISPYVVP